MFTFTNNQRSKEQDSTLTYQTGKSFLNKKDQVRNVWKDT